VEGLKIGLLNLGILWTALFVLICMIKIVALFLRTQHRQPVVAPHSFRKEFLSIYPLGWTVVIAAGFVTEFIAHTFTTRGSFLATVTVGFIPMTLVVVLLAFVRSRDRRR
jgi:hypothetical protein